MCGFVYVNSEKIDKSSVDKALNAIKYRGPDFKDTKAYDANFFLSHCRLSILDVNERSNQPMRSKNNAYSIIFNGEILRLIIFIYYLKEIISFCSIAYNIQFMFA